MAQPSVSSLITQNFGLFETHKMVTASEFDNVDPPSCCRSMILLGLTPQAPRRPDTLRKRPIAPYTQDIDVGPQPSGVEYGPLEVCAVRLCHYLTDPRVRPVEHWEMYDRLGLLRGHTVDGGQYGRVIYTRVFV